ncbi:hypothetical protein MF4640_18770 [Acinetobacter sp. MF4640]|nr:hypothetical protein MF4640_18770 [Acinetobacter sp. MF4640]
MVRGIANSKIGFGDLILLLRYFFKLKVSTHPNLTKNEEKKPATWGRCRYKLILTTMENLIPNNILGLY